MSGYRPGERGKATVMVVVALAAALAAGAAVWFLKPAPPAAPGGGGGEILFYRNPMNPNITSPVPAKDEMGMDYIPVYADASKAPTPKSYQQQADDFFAEGPPEGLAPVALDAAAIRLAGVVVAPATAESVSRTIRATGLVVPVEGRVRGVQTKVSGWVEHLVVTATGQQVAAGEPVLSLYSPELLATQEELARALAAGPEAQDLAAAARRKLALLGVSDAAIKAVEVGRSANRTVPIVSPFAGVVTAKGIAEGQQVAPGMELFTVTDLSEVWVEADVYEFEAADVRPGINASVFLPAGEGEPLVGKVVSILPAVAAESRTVKARVAVANADGALLPGMYARVEIALPAVTAVVVPDSAILDTGTRKILFVERQPGTFTPVAVTTGITSDGKVQVLSGVAAGEKVAVKATFLLDSESKLRAAIAGASAAGK